MSADYFPKTRTLRLSAVLAVVFSQWKYEFQHPAKEDSGNIVQPFALPWQSKQHEIVGSPNNVSTLISLPHRIHRPNLPNAIRSKASRRRKTDGVGL